MWWQLLGDRPQDVPRGCDVEVPGWGTAGLLWAGRDPFSQVETPEGLGPTQIHMSAKRGHSLAMVAPQHHPSGVMFEMVY